MHYTADEAPRRQTRSGKSMDLPVSRRRFFQLGAAWAVALAAAGCGGEEDEDEGGEEEED